jgi:hypothetical protein
VAWIADAESFSLKNKKKKKGVCMVRSSGLEDRINRYTRIFGELLGN